MTGVATVTTAELKARLRARYTGKRSNGVEYAYIEEVAENPQGGGRFCDAMAIGLWQSRGHQIIGHEIKVARADWLRELADLTKADPFIAYCRQWWIVAPTGVVDEHELPPNWGLLVPNRGKSLRVAVKAPTLTAEEPPPMRLFASIVRRAIQDGQTAESVDRSIEKARLGWEREHSLVSYRAERDKAELDKLRAAMAALREGLGERWAPLADSMVRIGELAAAGYRGDREIDKTRQDLGRLAEQLRARAGDLEDLVEASSAATSPEYGR